MSAAGLTRRRLLRQLAAAAGWIAGGGLAAACGRPTVDLAALARGRERLVFARAVGAAYLEAHPAEATAEALTAAVWRDLGWRARWLDEAGVAERLRERVGEELDDGELVEVERWWLAPTEARMAALAHLGAPPPA